MKREWACALWAVACLANAEEKPVPSYGNDDLVRLAPLRGQTGVLSEPAVRSGAEPAGKPGKEPGQGEGYWRAEAERVNAGLQKLRSAAVASRTRLEAARAAAREAAFKAAHGGKGAARGGSAPVTHETRIAALESELRVLEDTIRLRQDEFEERARRARALPGWIR